ncbi:TonB-dependent receptor [Bacteroides helcogenes]|uniref:TonB-dependent receptor n=1 Tax=Bacteroides helcogenes (strain ATCC 35417 / DSM 20613 / JCM 6297 / CCUG 15421 / P 36-108) TaxID=693979 RepID=E6SSQ6_BACT6|nr:TonB-dependent receptor [Bacteroides helcogenes]ADV43169.1 TonB-dependent receptor [Bacteroides helcogenes P 36-108]MDY5239148.1 TonB-dependent receptor [Bacteroides helcogenes]
MNKHKFVALALTLLATGNILAEKVDTLKVVDVEEILVIAAPKENRKLREQPTAVTLLSQRDMQAAQVNSIKSLTALVPNMFIPDYGSRLTSAVYIRGIGSRINTPSVGLYVDNIPYIDKSAFDFNYSDIERIDVLRGPQGTLYGRNAMGGLIKIHTKSPFSYQGTDFRIGAGTHNAYNTSLTHYHRVSSRFAFSTGGFYDYQGGFFRNAARNNEKVDKGQAVGGRFRGIYLPSDNWKVDLNVNYEYSDQGGYPYFYMGSLNAEKQSEALKPYIGKIANNERSSYYRNLLNAGLNIEYQARNFILSAVTGYQFLKDRMFMDQDFTPASIFNIEQKQKMNTLSEEIVLKSKPGRRWQWTTGAFGFYQWMHTDGPVVFHKEGIGSVIEGNVNNVFDGLASRPGAPAMHLGINNESLRIGGSFDTPTLSGALFHQSTFNDLLVRGLSATIGLRLDYEKIKMDYNSASDATDFNFSLAMKMPPMTLESNNLQANAAYRGKESTDYVQLLPKFALQYEWKKGNNVYVTVARGYRSGGYNIQMFSDLVTGMLKNSMMDAIAADPKFSSMSAMIEKMKDTGLPEVSEATRYKPEYTWNYEAGTHLTLWKGRLLADISAFYMDTRNQQIAKFAESGLGRITVNAGKSRSYGTEASLRAAVTDALTLNAGYGYTHATFKDYITNTKADGELQSISYNGNYVPFVPKHTLNIGGQYIFRIKPGHLLNRILLDANYTGAGRIYWTEANNASQAFYGTLNGCVSFQKGNGQIDFWVRNALDKGYTAFYFESMGNGIMQKGRPIQAGVELRCRF